MEQYDKAADACRNAIRLNPNLADAYNNLGAILFAQQKLVESEQVLRKAIELKPDYAEAYSNLGNTLNGQGRLHEAKDSCTKAISLNPGLADAHNNLGAIFRDLKQLDQAEESFKSAIKSDPAHPDALFNLSLLCLLQGDFYRGLRLYENRKIKHPSLGTRWYGDQSLQDKSILMYSEQGLGDTILFSRYIPLVKALGAKVVFQVQPALVPLMSSLEGVDQLISQTSEVESVDYQCPLLSLPLVFQTDFNNLPAVVPYLHASKDCVDSWNQQLGSNGFKIGICWQGTKKDRAIPIEHFAQFAAVDQVRLISLHKGLGEKDLANLPAGMTVETLGQEFDSKGAFTDTAAVMQCCDLIISNDASVAHLAGALGIPVWVALIHVPDWRWFLDREDSPWYPSMRLFRQDHSKDWLSVLTKMQQELLTKVQQKTVDQK